VSLALLGALAFWPERRRLTLGCLAWAMLIAASTLTTRQHVLVDVAGGVVVALASHWLTRWQESRAPRTFAVADLASRASAGQPT
jgi:membrane-associated phospholipid phosphatase